MEPDLPSPEPQFHTRYFAIRKRLEAYEPASPFGRALFEFGLFGFKQGWACLFGGLILFLLLVTHLYYPAGWPLARYDFLFLAALSIQAILLITRMETLEEAKVIFAFHLVGTVMELFKTHMGSWSYPEENFIRIAGVPLFSGFMYASVGSYIARIWRIFEFRFTAFPPRWATVLLAVAIYVNFFSHHFLPDIRFGLFAATLVVFGRTWVHYRPHRHERRMPMIVGFLLVALFIWAAENIATFAHAWMYPAQAAGWTMVPVTKLGAWFLLMIISFVLVSLVHRPERAMVPAARPTT